ncbi:MAG: phosphoglycerate kinase, partial [Actinomycetota bacterium]|nr:phosphoglycerate kinase [Actinomycetota bacterium]
SSKLVARMSEPLPTHDDLDVKGRRVMVRCDLNVPLRDGEITDDLRIRSAVPTLEALLKKGAKLVVCSHLGRPKGKVDESLRLAPVGRRLSELLGRDITIVQEVVGDEATRASESDDEVVLLENLRFEPGETKNDPEFADALAALAEAYVNDAFGAVHRAHASVVGVPERLPAAAGLLLHEEVEKLERVLHSAEHPFVAILGGAKVSDKLGVISNLLERVDTFCIGGAMAFTLLVARGEEVGRSLVEKDQVDEVKKTLAEADAKGVEILLPSDVVAADSPEEGAAHETVPLEKIGDRLGVDIGPETAAAFAKEIEGAKTVLWNGPMGIFEIDDYAEGTRKVAEAVAAATKNGAYTVVGGGDSAAALKQLGLSDSVSHLSTGGGASLELLEGKELPGIAVLRKQKRSEKAKELS